MHHFIFIGFVQFCIISEVIDFLEDYLSSFFLVKFLLGFEDPGFLGHLIVEIFFFVLFSLEHVLIVFFRLLKSLGELCLLLSSKADSKVTSFLLVAVMVVILLLSIPVLIVFVFVVHFLIDHHILDNILNKVDRI